MKVHPEGDGARLKLSAPELRMLTGLLDELLDDLQPDALATSDPVRTRLFPSGYRDGDDLAEAAAFRELTEDSLRAERIARAELCRAEVATKRTVWRGFEMQLDAEAAERWMRVLNDMRLTLGTRLGISADDDYRVHVNDPQLRRRAHYLWLTALQDMLINTRLPD